MTKLAGQSRRCANVLIGSHFVAGFFLSVVSYVVRLIEYADNEGPREFPVKMEFSFEAEESPVYEFIVIGQMFYEISLATIVGMVNALLATLVSRLLNLLEKSITFLFSYILYLKILYILNFRFF